MHVPSHPLHSDQPAPTHASIKRAYHQINCTRSRPRMLPTPSSSLSPHSSSSSTHASTKALTIRFHYTGSCLPPNTTPTPLTVTPTYHYSFLPLQSSPQPLHLIPSIYHFITIATIPPPLPLPHTSHTCLLSFTFALLFLTFLLYPLWYATTYS